MQGTVTLITPINLSCRASSVAWCEEFLAGVLELLHVLSAFGLLCKPFYLKNMIFKTSRRWGLLELRNFNFH